MSSSRPAERRGLAALVRGWSLRTRLTVIVVCLVALVCLAVGIGTEVALRGFLLGQLDGALDDATQRAAQEMARREHPPPPPGAQRVGTPRIAGFGQPQRTLVLVYSPGGAVVRNYIVHDRGRTRIKADQYPALRDVVPGADPVSVGLDDPLGSYRIEAVRLPDGTVVVAGLPLGEVDDTLLRVALVELVIATAALAVGGTVGALIVRGTLRPLRRVAATASRVAELPLDRGEVALSVRVPDADTDQRTEVGQVGSAINRMLGHVAGALSARHVSEQRVRQFLADASHELRTPLAAIRGYAELTRRGGYRLPGDVVQAIGRVESESARMTTLVDDLLLLARLDSGRPLAREEVDLTRIVVDAVSDAHVAGPDHGWRLDLPDEPVTVTGDAARLHQVLANLLANARTHTPPGTTVTTALRGSTGPVVLTVADDGPGIPPDLLPEVFERFARGDSSRSRAAGSTGLGMAIVAAVVAAHGGRVTVASVPGATTVRVELPG